MQIYLHNCVIRYVWRLSMIYKLLSILFVPFLAASVFAEDVPVPPEISENSSAATNQPASPATSDSEIITIYETKVFPGLRKCTEEEARDKNYSPIACQNEKEAVSISTREQQQASPSYIVEDDAVPQGNIFKLKFDRFKRKK